MRWVKVWILLVALGVTADLDAQIDFIRGDVDDSGTVSGLVDSLYLLQWQFLDGDDPACMDAADADGNGAVSGLIDSLYLLNWQFNDGAAPPDPGPTECGPDPEDNDLDCLASSCVACEVQETKLMADDGEEGDLLGESISVDGEVMVVGAIRDDDAADQAGAVYVYRWDDDDEVWEEEQKLTASDGEEWDRFGCSVTVSGDVIAVGTHWADSDDYDNTGAVYVFRYDDVAEEWEEEQRLVGSECVEWDQFGFSIDSSEGLIVVGAPQRVVGSDQGTGVVYVFTYDDDLSEWVEDQILEAEDADLYDAFGRGLATEDDLIVVGAPNDDEEGSNAGAAYVFRYDADDLEWVEEQKLMASDGSGADWLGEGLDLDAGAKIIAVGAWDEDEGGAGAGAVYVYEYDEDDELWEETQKLIASDSENQQDFGFTVALAEGILAVGAPGDDVGFAEFDAGAAYAFVYDEDLEEWVEEEILVAEERDLGAELGHAVFVSGGRLFATAPRDEEIDINSGAVHIFDLCPID